MEVRNQALFNLLNQNPNLPALIYFNHQTGDDPLVVASLLLNHTPKRNLVIMPTSHTYRQFFGSQPHYALAVKLAEGFLNWQMPSIIQAYRRREEENKKGNNHAEALAKVFFELLKKFIPQGATVVIAPEGHRSRLGKILPAEKGTGLVVKLMEQNNGLVLPLAIRYPKGRNYSLNFNPIIKTEVVVICGPLMEVKDVLEEVRKTIPQNRINFSTISHFLMWKLAQSLPESMQGVYHQSLVERTFQGDFELRINPQTNQVGVWDKRYKCFLEGFY